MLAPPLEYKSQTSSLFTPCSHLSGLLQSPPTWSLLLPLCSLVHFQNNSCRMCMRLCHSSAEISVSLPHFSQREIPEPPKRLHGPTGCGYAGPCWPNLLRLFTPQSNHGAPVTLASCLLARRFFLDSCLLRPTLSTDVISCESLPTTPNLGHPCPLLLSYLYPWD